MKLFKKVVNGITDNSIFRRITYMYLCFFLFYFSIMILSYFIFPEGFFRGKHPIISSMKLSSNICKLILQIFTYNLIPLVIVIGGNIISQESIINKGKYIPIGYFAFFTIVTIFSLYVGTWSFEIVSQAPSLLVRVFGIFDIRHSGVFELSAYLIATVSTCKISIWYSDRKKIIERKKIKEIRLCTAEKFGLLFSFVLLFSAATVEAINIL